MKIRKIMRRHCPYCKKHTEHKVALAKKKGRNAAHPLSRGSTKRLRRRGQRRGVGSLGKYSKPAVSKFKMAGKKLSKKTDLRYTCKECNKTHTQSKGFRVKRLEFV